MHALVLQVLANGRRQSSLTSKKKKERKNKVRSGKWRMLAHVSNQTAGMGGMRACALSPSASRAIMSPSGEMNPWKRHIILITKAFGLSSLTNATGGTIMYFSNPIEQSAAGFVEAQPLEQ